MRYPLQVVFTPPSATGKSTCQGILGASGDFEIGITATDRPVRKGVPDTYDRVSKWLWWLYRLTGAMAESSTNYGRHYGILRKRIEQAKRTDRPTIWALNVEGLTWMRREFGASNVLPILLWAEPHVLRERMEKRGDNPMSIQCRLAAAPQEITKALDHGAIQINTTHLTPEEVARAVRAQVEWWYVKQK